jgi:hypothetical protein
MWVFVGEQARMESQFFLFGTTDVPDSIPGRVEVPQKLRYALATLHSA